MLVYCRMHFEWNAYYYRCVKLGMSNEEMDAGYHQFVCLLQCSESDQIYQIDKPSLDFLCNLILVTSR